MAWKEMTVDELAKLLGVDASEVREKQRLIQLIVTARKKKGLSQVALAKKVGVSQGRIGQIESGIGTGKISFDVLLSILTALGYHYKVVMTKAA